MKLFKNRGRLTLVAAMGVVLAGIVFVLSNPAFAQGTNLVYLESNIGSLPNMNSVFVFSNDGAGNLTQITGSPFLTSGTGWYDPGLETTSIDTDHALIIDPAGSNLYAVNADSDTISGFSIGTGGALTLTTNPPLGSGGKEPQSLSLSFDLLHNGYSVLVVANKDNDPNQTGGVPNIQTATVNGQGTIKPVPHSKISFDAGDYLGSVNATPLAPQYVFGIQLAGGSLLFSYKIVSLGKMLEVSSIGPPNDPDHQFLGIAFHPTQKVMYVGIPSADMIGVYTYSATGTLTFVTEVSNPGDSPCWFAINAAGTVLYSAESGTGTLTVYDTTNALAPVQVQHVTLSNQPQRATDIKIDPTGNFLYSLGVANTNELGSPYLHVFSISQIDGTLTELTPVALPVAQLEHPQGLAVLMQ